jgi:hypothetical protein
MKIEKSTFYEIVYSKNWFKYQIWISFSYIKNNYYLSSLIAAWAAANLATGTLYGEQDT